MRKKAIYPHQMIHGECFPPASLLFGLPIAQINCFTIVSNEKYFLQICREQTFDAFDMFGLSLLDCFVFCFCKSIVPPSLGGLQML